MVLRWELWWVRDPNLAHLIDEELQLQNGGSTLVLTVGVHSRSSQSDGPKSQGSTEKISNKVEKRARQKTFDHEWGRSDEGLPPSWFWNVCFGSHQSIFKNSRNCFYSDVQKKSDIEKSRSKVRHNSISSSPSSAPPSAGGSSTL